MQRVTRFGLASALVALVLAGVAGAFEPGSPEETLRTYLQALKDGKFDVAYDRISKSMQQGKDREVWVKEQTAMMAVADVKIFSFDVQPGKVENERAQVPNVLESQDRFVNTLGLTEYELYTLIREGGRWKVDQQILVEPSELPKWFPKARKPDADSEPRSH